jgi:hypothetical protein
MACIFETFGEEWFSMNYMKIPALLALGLSSALFLAVLPNEAHAGSIIPKQEQLSLKKDGKKGKKKDKNKKHKKKCEKCGVNKKKCCCTKDKPSNKN